MRQQGEQGSRQAQVAQPVLGEDANDELTQAATGILPLRTERSQALSLHQAVAQAQGDSQGQTGRTGKQQEVAGVGNGGLHGQEKRAINDYL